MRTAIVSLFLLLPGIAFAQQDTKFYTPEKKIDAPTFINAEVVRVNRDNTATFRSESGEITLTADDSTTAAIGALHPGDKVLVEYREVKGPSGRMTRYVTSVKEASPTSGEPGRRRVVGGQTVGATPVSNTVGGVTTEPATTGTAAGAARAQGERDLETSAVALAAAAAAIDPAWVGFKNQCLTGSTVTTVTAGREWYLLADDRIPTPADDACRTMFTDVTGRARGFLSQLETVEDAARKADVLPARVREVLDRHKL